MEHGIIEDWNDVEKLWSYIYSKEGLGIQAEGALQHTRVGLPACP
jgi:actin-related protein